MVTYTLSDRRHLTSQIIKHYGVLCALHTEDSQSNGNGCSVANGSVAYTEMPLDMHHRMDSMDSMDRVIREETRHIFDVYVVFTAHARTRRLVNSHYIDICID